jgi:serine/threonine protein kinase
MSKSAIPFEADDEKITTEEQRILLLRRHFCAQKMTQELFSLGSTLGTGTFGRVRLVTYKHTDGKKHVFALKMLKKSEVIRLKQVEHIKSEKQILSRISHPYVVSLYSAFQDSLYLYMLMEYVIGGELFSQLRKVGRFSNSTARFYAQEIVLAFEYMHTMDIVYRDLKPENLLIDSRGHIKITDFGFAKVVTDRTWTLCGTPEYLAPEIIQSKGHGKGVDWWALGVLIYEMTAGYPPYSDENPYDIYKKILQGDFQCPSHFSSECVDIVRKLLTADRTKRYGCLKDGAKDIKDHPWFAEVDWALALAGRIKPPFVPAVGGPEDTGHFDQYPEGEEAMPTLSQTDQDVFNDF